MTDFDTAALDSWLRRHQLSIEGVEPLPGDVSARRYARLRLRDGRSAIAAWYPPELRDACRRFERSTVLLERAGVAVPGVWLSDCAVGLALLEDAGGATLYDLRDRPLGELVPHYERGLEVVARIGEIDAGEVAALNPPLDATLLRRELRQTVEFYLEPSGLLGDADQRADIEHGLDRLCAALGDAPAIPCHRDLMARNLVPADGERLVVLDHQDLRLGPRGYDLASLLNDSFFPPHDLEEAWCESFLPSLDARLDYHRAASQRTLKAIGTFAAFAARGADRHLPLISPTLARALHHLARAPETAPLTPLLERLWRPAALAARE